MNPNNVTLAYVWTMPNLDLVHELLKEIKNTTLDWYIKCSLKIKCVDIKVTCDYINHKFVIVTYFMYKTETFKIKVSIPRTQTINIAVAAIMRRASVKCNELENLFSAENIGLEEYKMTTDNEYVTISDLFYTKNVEHEMFKRLGKMIGDMKLDYPVKLMTVSVTCDSDPYRPQLYRIVVKYNYRGDEVHFPHTVGPIAMLDNTCFDIMLYIKNRITKIDKKKNRPPKSKTIEKVIFNNPATIVFWKDGTKTVVKCGPVDEFDKEKGLAMAITKKLMSDNKGNYYETFKKYIPELED